MEYYRKFTNWNIDHQNPTKKHHQHWLARKAKYYNPAGKCQVCVRAVSKHSLLCPACIEEKRWWEGEEKSYRDTITSIRADWYR